MYLLTNKNITNILHNLSPLHLDHLRDALGTSLSQFTAQHTSPNASIDIHQPHRSHLTTSRGITTLTMPVSDTCTTGVKVVTLAPGSAAQGSITIYTAEGALLGVLNAEQITAFRTALASMLALKLYIRDSQTPNSDTKKSEVVVFGAGKQAEWHIRLVLRVLGHERIAKVTVVNRGRARLGEWKSGIFQELRAAYPSVTFSTLEHDARVDTTGHGVGTSDPLRSTLSSANIIFCTTPSTEPLFPAAYLKDDMGHYSKRMFVALIGSYKPEMQEIHTKTILDALADSTYGKIMVDSSEACLAEAGELLRAGLKEENLIEVGELWKEEKPRVPGDAETATSEKSGIVVFKCVGMALMDMAVGLALMEIAKEVGEGMEISDF